MDVPMCSYGAGSNRPCNQQAVLMCMECVSTKNTMLPTSYCMEHYNKKHDPWERHFLFNIKDGMELLSSALPKACTAEQLMKDSDNLACHIVQTGDALTLQPGNKLSAVFADMCKPTEAVQAIGFTGPSGSGKSHLLRMFVAESESPGPLASAHGQTQAMTGDVRIYRGACELAPDGPHYYDEHSGLAAVLGGKPVGALSAGITAAAPMPFFALDTEGTGGTSTTTTDSTASAGTFHDMASKGKAFVASTGNALTAVSNKLATMAITAPPAAAGAHGAPPDKRISCVEYAYPRLLYMFMDVVVYVTNVPHRNRKAVIEKLLQYSTASSTGVSNMAYRPSLVIVHNKLSLEDGEGHWASDEASTREYLDPRLVTGATDLLDRYSDVRVVCIPAWSTSKQKYHEQLRLLKGTVLGALKAAAETKAAKARNGPLRKFLGPTGLLFSREGFTSTFGMSVDHLDKSPDQPFDIGSMLVNSQSPPSDLMGCLFELFMQALEISIDCSKPDRDMVSKFDAAVDLMYLRLVDAATVSILRAAAGEATATAAVGTFIEGLKRGNLPPLYEEVAEKLWEKVQAKEPCGSSCGFARVLFTDKSKHGTSDDLCELPCYEVRGFHGDKHSAPFARVKKWSDRLQTALRVGTGLTLGALYIAANVLSLGAANQVFTEDFSTANCVWSGSYEDPHPAGDRSWRSCVQSAINTIVPLLEGNGEPYLSARVAPIAKQVSAVPGLADWMLASSKHHPNGCSSCCSEPATANHAHCFHRVCETCSRDPAVTKCVICQA